MAPPRTSGKYVLSLYLFPLAAPIVLLCSALFASLRPGRRPGLVPAVAEAAALAEFLIAAVSLAMLILRGPGSSGLVGIGGAGLSARIDAVSVTMLLLVSFVGWIVVRYSRTYLDGEERQGAFTGWMCTALAAVLLLVHAGTSRSSWSPGSQPVFPCTACCFFIQSVFRHNVQPARSASSRSSALSPLSWRLAL